MKILEEAPTHYRVRLDSGHEMVIARTPGTQAIVVSHDPTQGLAEGGEVPTTGAEADAGLVDFSPEGLDASAKELAARQAEEKLAAAKAAAAPNLAQARRTNDPNEITHAQEAMRSAGLKPQEIAQQISGQVPALEPGAQAAPAPTEPSENAEAAPSDIMRSLSFSGTSASATPGMPSMAGYDKAVAKFAEDSAKSQEALAAQYASMKPPTAPAPTPVDPGQLYAHIGAMFGAKDPRAQRIIGGIATGLMAGIGEIGAALSHRQNTALEIIQGAIKDNLASQENANALTRQQWLDQTQYATALANNKVAEIGASAKAKEIRDQVPILQALNRAAMYRSLMQQGVFKPAELEPLALVEDGRASALRYAASYKRIPEGAGATVDQFLSKYGHISNPKITEAYATADRLKADYVKAMFPSGSRPPSDAQVKQAENQCPVPGEPYQTQESKLRVMADSLRQKQAVQNAVLHGHSPTGIGSITPGARPN